MKVLDRIPIASRLIHFSTDKAFMLKANGKGMEPNICNKDMLICEEVKNFKSGDFIVISDKNGLMIRKALRQEGGLVILQKMNQKQSDQTSIIPESDLKLIGIVRQIIRNL